MIAYIFLLLNWCQNIEEVASFSLLIPKPSVPNMIWNQKRFQESFGNKIGNRVKLFSSFGDEDEEDEDLKKLLGDRDWRAFRAKLVMGEGSDDSSSAGKDDELAAAIPSNSSLSDKNLVEDDPDALAFAALDPQIWAYDTGKVIEKGAVILGGIEQSFGFGLRQQYFHKAVMLVLDHDDRFTRGIILNRPSSKIVLDENEKGDIVQWKLWFGGDVQGFGSPMMEVFCLHSLQIKEAMDVSYTVMKDIQWTTFDNARNLVMEGKASPSDFWVFAGYAGWGPEQLAGELDRKSWYMVSTDSQTLLQEMARQARGQDPRNAGLDTWTMLMDMIGKSDLATESSGSFDDLMLKEWARENLVMGVEKASFDARRRVSPSTDDLSKIDPIDRVIKQASAAAKGQYVGPGMMVRASSAERSPYLLSKQEFHKSVVLVISEDDNLTTGAILNRPSSRGVQLQITSKKSGSKRTVIIPLRYGGEYTVRGDNKLLWVHCKQSLRDIEIGKPLGMNNVSGVWKCSPEEASSAIAEGLAEPTDFIVVSGMSVWTKGEKGKARGISGEIEIGNFEIIPKTKTSEVFEKLLQQEVLSEATLQNNLDVSNEAWNVGCSTQSEVRVDEPILDGIGDEFDEEDDSKVYQSNTKLTTLSDKALRSWIATFLLGEPSLG